jgi:CheY-like chemotaxis protein
LQQHDLQGVRVRVIEDDVLVSQAMVMILSSWGCEVATASGIQDALEQLRTGPCPQLVLSDYRLRDGENGLDAVRLIREAVKFPIPACLMSGDVASNLANVCREAGIHFLQKPVRPDALQRHLLNILLLK